MSGFPPLDSIIDGAALRSFLQQCVFHNSFIMPPPSTPDFLHNFYNFDSSNNNNNNSSSSSSSISSSSSSSSISRSISRSSSISSVMSNDAERASLLARIAALEARMNQMESRTTIIITHAPQGAPSIVINPPNAASISTSTSTIRIPPELSSSDFGIPSPASAHQPERMNDTPAESIPLVQQQLEKFIIVVAGLVAHILAPQLNAAGTGINNQTRIPLAREENQRDTSVDASQSENRRLTMHAGHTPNHSISRFHLLGEGDAESGSATPTQELHDENERMLAPPAHGEAEQHSEDDHEDRELSHPLGLTNDAVANHGFLAELDEKLRVAKTIADAGPSNEPEPSPSPLSSPGDIEDDRDETHKIRLKPSCNFGKPLGEI